MVVHLFATCNAGGSASILIENDQGFSFFQDSLVESTTFYHNWTLNRNLYVIDDLPIGDLILTINITSFVNSTIGGQFGNMGYLDFEAISLVKRER